MFTKQQEKLLEKFAGNSDKLFDLGIITTDSFTGEIGEFIACNHFKLIKSERVTKAIDAVCENAKKYQIKSNVVFNNNFRYNIDKLDTTAFDYLVVVYFDYFYKPLKILRLPAEKINNNKILITSSVINSGIEIIEKEKVNLQPIHKSAIKEFAKSYLNLSNYKIIRSRRIVGDIGEFYACKHLDLVISENKNEKGIDAIHPNGLTFEIKTRRVYESGRRNSETRRLNNLVGKAADYLIVVTLDRAFKCSGMWLIPLGNLHNPKSANLKIVNNTFGTKNLIPSKISWLVTGEPFTAFEKQ